MKALDAINTFHAWPPEIRAACIAVETALENSRPVQRSLMPDFLEQPPAPSTSTWPSVVLVKANQAQPAASSGGGPSPATVPRKRKPYKKVLGCRKWTPEDEQAIYAEFEQYGIGDKNRVAGWSMQFHRSRDAIYSKYQAYKRSKGAK